MNLDIWLPTAPARMPLTKPPVNTESDCGRLMTGNPEEMPPGLVPANVHVADDSSLNRTDWEIIDSPSWLLAVVRRIRHRQCAASGSGRAYHQTVRKDTLRCSNGASGRKTDNMPSPEKDRLAAEAIQCWVDFQEGLSSDNIPCNSFELFGRSQNARNCCTGYCPRK